MFSYPPAILQTHAAKRAENQFNGANESPNGSTTAHVETAASAVPRGRSRVASIPALSRFPSRPPITSVTPSPQMPSITFLNWTLALASATMYSLHQPALQPVPLKPTFACELCCTHRKSPDLVVLHRNLSTPSGRTPKCARRLVFGPDFQIRFSDQEQEIP
jgi:hypothetical protein